MPEGTFASTISPLECPIRAFPIGVVAASLPFVKSASADSCLSEAPWSELSFPADYPIGVIATHTHVSLLEPSRHIINNALLLSYSGVYMYSGINIQFF